MSLSLRMGNVLITDQVFNIQTKNIAEGGYASVTFNVKRKLDQSLFDTFTDVMTFDEATGEQTGGGRLLEQGRNDDGTWSVTCLGEGPASMQDRTTPHCLIDGTLDNWVRSSRTTKRVDVQNTVYPNSSTDEPALMFSTTEGQAFTSGAELIITNKVLLLTGQQLGGFGFKHKEGVSDSNMRLRARAFSSDLSSWTTPTDAAWSTTLSSRIANTVNGDFPAGRTVAGFQWTPTTTVAAGSVDSNTWSAIKDPVLRAQIYGSDGNLKVAGYTNEYVLPHEAAIDWVVRYCPRLTVAGGTVDTSSTQQIEQMCYLDGVHGMQLMEDVYAVEPALRWAVWEQDASGKWPFYYQPLPTTVRYEASVDDGFSAPSPSSEIYNKVTVTGKTPNGRDINVTATSTVPALDALGLIREATIPFGSEVWSTTSANKAAPTFLVEHSVAPNAGTVTIARRILDNFTGRWIEPQHIRAGYLMRVRGIQPTPDTLNATSPDGVTVFDVASATFDNDSKSTVCELDEPTLTESRAIARLARKRSRRGSTS